MRAPCAPAASATCSAPTACTASNFAARLGEDADQIDQHVGVARRRLDRGGVAQIGLYRVDLPDPAERLQMAGKSGRRTATRMR